MDKQRQIRELSESIVSALFEGGSGSGNYGHKGRPGMRGGSLPTKAGSIAVALLKSEKGGFRFPKLSRSLFGAARKVRNLEVIASGSPKKMARRVLNILIGRTIVRKLFR